jgi:hypothetical protein
MAFPKWYQDGQKFAGLNPSQQAMAKAVSKQQMPAYAQVAKGGYNQFLMQGAYKAAEELGFYKKAEPAPAPAPAPSAPAPAAAPAETKVEVTPETKALQDETKKILDELATTKKDLEDSKKQFELYKEEQTKIKETAQATSAAQFANQAMAGLAPTLQIGGAAAGPMKTGTSAFKIKKQKTGPVTSTISPLNIGSSSTLNI